jgi:hypothetical protein
MLNGKNLVVINASVGACIEPPVDNRLWNSLDLILYILCKSRSGYFSLSSNRLFTKYINPRTSVGCCRVTIMINHIECFHKVASVLPWPCCFQVKFRSDGRNKKRQCRWDKRKPAKDMHSFRNNERQLATSWKLSLSEGLYKRTRRTNPKRGCWLVQLDASAHDDNDS